MKKGKMIPIRTKLLGVILPVVMIIVIVLVAISYSISRATISRSAENLLNTSVDNQVNEISAWLENSLPVQGEDEGSSLPGDKICEHSYRTDIVPATARQDGSITRICVSCGTVESRSVITQAESLKLSKTSYTYNGKLKKPGITIEDSQGGMLTEGKDYTLVYPNHAKDPGIYKVAACFKGNYSGTIEGSFSIKPKAVAISKISPKKFICLIPHCLQC